MIATLVGAFTGFVLGTGIMNQAQDTNACYAYATANCLNIQEGFNSRSRKQWKGKKVRQEMLASGYSNVNSGSSSKYYGKRLEGKGYRLIEITPEQVTGYITKQPVLMVSTRLNFLNSSGGKFLWDGSTGVIQVIDESQSINHATCLYGQVYMGQKIGVVGKNSRGGWRGLKGDFIVPQDAIKLNRYWIIEKFKS